MKHLHQFQHGFVHGGLSRCFFFFRLLERGEEVFVHLTGEMLTILVKAVAVYIHDHSALTVTRVLLDGLYIAAADFQLQTGAAVT